MASNVDRLHGTANYMNTRGETDQPFSTQLKKAGSKLHREVELAPISQAMFQATVTEEGYIDYLACLREIYQQLEEELRVNGESPVISPLIIPGMFRFSYIEKDLAEFGATEREPHSLALKYKDHLRYLGEYQPHRLIAHAYLRYLGDLFGGMMIARKLENRFEGKLNFYDFSELCNQLQVRAPTLYARSFCSILDKLPLNADQKSDVINEVITGYEIHRDLFKELKA